MSLKTHFALLAVGAGAAYFLDREHGRERCEEFKEQCAAVEDLVEDLVTAGQDAGARVSEFIEQVTENPVSVASSPMAQAALGSLLILGGLRSAGLTSLLLGGAGAALLSRRKNGGETVTEPWHATNLTH